MKLIEKEQLYEVPYKEYKNLHQLFPVWQSNGWMNKEDVAQCKLQLDALNKRHHNEASFNDRIIELATWDNKIHSIDRQNFGGECFGFVHEGITIYTESIEFGIIMLVKEENITQENISTLTYMMNWISHAIDNPKEAHIEMQYEHIKTHLNDVEKEKKVMKI